MPCGSSQRGGSQRGGSQRGRTSRRAERGATVVEFSLVVPLLLFLLFGIIEVNFGLFGVHRATQALADATRAGAIAQDDASADLTIINALVQSPPPGVTIESVTIYKARNFDAPPPVTCTTSCTVYTGTALGRDVNWTKCANEHGGICTFSGLKTVRYGAPGGWTTKAVTGPVRCENDVFGDPLVGTVKACYLQTSVVPTCTAYCPADRRPYDLLGVSVQMSYQSVTRAVPFRYVFQRHAVSPIEPRIV